MAFRVEISPRAFDDLDEIARYIKRQSSFEQAAQSPVDNKEPRTSTTGPRDRLLP